MFVVFGASGKTGSAVANALLEKKQPVRVVVRDAAKGETWKARGAEVVVTTMEDRAGLTKALAGAQGAYVLLPPDMRSKDLVAENRARADNLAAVLRQTPVRHVVFLSSVGAQHPDKTGPIKALHYGEQVLGGLPGVTLTSLRASSFMENQGSGVAPAKGQGILPALYDPTLKVDMVATFDIGTTAAKALLEPPAHHQVIELGGPETYSFEDVAAAFSKALGKPIKVAPLPSAAIVPTLTQFGISENVAGLYREMAEGLMSGVVAFEGGAALRLRGVTPLDTVIHALCA